MHSPGLNQNASQNRVPILDALTQYQTAVRFHMPGHRGGKGAEDAAKTLLGEKAFLNDVTGVPGLDDLHQPHGCIQEAQNLAAQAFGADSTFFSVNGTTGAIHAMVLSTIKDGDAIIIPRNIHKSVLAAIVLSGARPIFVPAVHDPYLGFPLGVDNKSMEMCVKENPEAKAALLVNPTYYGTALDLTPLASCLHRNGMVLLVDEAHGPHCKFHPILPKPALDSDADAVAQGAHKIIGAFTQASMLHLKGNRIDMAKLKAAYRYITTTSASYLLLASLDAARRQMALNGRELLERAISMAEHLRGQINSIPGLYCFGADILDQNGVDFLDPTKVTITVRELEITGYQAETFLRDIHGLQVEMSDLYNVLVIVSFGNTPQEIEKLLEALKDLVSAVKEDRLEKRLRHVPKSLPQIPKPPKMHLTPKMASQSEWKRVNLAYAKGQISAEVVTCYPPGIPILYPGETITQETVTYLRMVKDLALGISGPEDRTLNTLRVVKSC